MVGWGRFDVSGEKNINNKLFRQVFFCLSCSRTQQKNFIPVALPDLVGTPGGDGGFTCDGS